MHTHTRTYMHTGCHSCMKEGNATFKIIFITYAYFRQKQTISKMMAVFAINN